mmetsp:Transcript_52042/g.144165  ORF Transcript_52042/g.144165 Transcript_52042/m.144165 type:complete len:316 (-) Transcript_52042:469-1416(-)
MESAPDAPAGALSRNPLSAPGPTGEARASSGLDRRRPRRPPPPPRPTSPPPSPTLSRNSTLRRLGPRSPRPPNDTGPLAKNAVSGPSLRRPARDRLAGDVSARFTCTIACLRRCSRDSGRNSSSLLPTSKSTLSSPSTRSRGSGASIIPGARTATCVPPVAGGSCARTRMPACPGPTRMPRRRSASWYGESVTDSRKCSNAEIISAARCSMMPRYCTMLEWLTPLRNSACTLEVLGNTMRLRVGALSSGDGGSCPSGGDGLARAARSITTPNSTSRALTASLSSSILSQPSLANSISTTAASASSLSLLAAARSS